jgi:uncharacterized membrane protein YebE (DUF533 family)
MENTILTAILIVGILVAIGVMIHTAMDEYKNTKIRETATRVVKTRQAYTGSLTDNSQQSKVSDDDPKVTSSHPRKKRQNDKSKTKSRRNIVKAGRRANR